jgi:hypothetical protein
MQKEISLKRNKEQLEQRKEEIDAQRSAHQRRTQFDSAYSNYINSVLNQVQRENPDIYKRFEAYITSKWKDIPQQLKKTVNPQTVMGKSLYENWVLEFFQGFVECKLLSFEEWDTQYNTCSL